jgi:hypothetical protein
MGSIHISEPLDKDPEIGDPVRVTLAEETSISHSEDRRKTEPKD